MSQDVELAKTTAETVASLAKSSGVLGPPRELLEAITAGIHYRNLPRVMKQAQLAAERIKASRLPPRAYDEIPDALIRAILVGGSEESDESMQERWANLLANALVDSPVDMRVAFPGMLAELEPGDARLLDEAEKYYAEGNGMKGPFCIRELESVLAFENLERLNLMQRSSTQPDEGAKSPYKREMGVRVTELGRAFAQACREPGRR